MEVEDVGLGLLRVWLDALDEELGSSGFLLEIDVQSRHIRTIFALVLLGGGLLPQGGSGGLFMLRLCF